MTIDSGRGWPGTTWSHKLVSGRIPAMKRRLPEDDLRVMDLRYGWTDPGGLVTARDRIYLILIF